MKKNVRAAASKGGTVDGDHRWFHLNCFKENNRGFPYPIDFPSSAKSGHTRCAACRLPINFGTVTV